MTRRRDLRFAVCPVCPFAWASNDARLDAGLFVASHVRKMHPALLYSPEETARRELEARIATRRN